MVVKADAIKIYLLLYLTQEESQFKPKKSRAALVKECISLVICQRVHQGKGGERLGQQVRLATARHQAYACAIFQKLFWDSRGQNE